MKSIISHKISNLLNKNIYLLNFINLIICYSIRVPKTNTFIKKYNIKLLNNLNIYETKKSDTLFVLGTGSSICNYKDREWKIISEHDSIGINDWIIHDFVPTFLSLEWNRNFHVSSIYLKNLKSKADQYTKTQIILRNYLAKDTNIDYFLKNYPSQLINNTYVSNNFPVPGNNINNYEKSLIFLLNKSILAKIKKNSSVLLTKRSSVFSCIYLGYLYNYKKIILCGIDLTDSKYFYEVNKSYYQNKGLVIPPTLQFSDIHSTINPDISPVTIDKVIRAFNNIILKPNKIELSVAFKSSGLYPYLPSYFE